MRTRIPRNGQLLANRYRVDRLIGRGGMGVVYSGTDLENNETVAIKFITSHNTNGSSLRRFFRGARLSRAIRHRHIVKTLDFGRWGENDEASFMVMEMVRGVSLSALINSELTYRERVGLISQVLQGLAHMHARSIFHRDIKPDNILVQPLGNHVLSVRITDFGLAAAGERAADVSELTGPGVALGTAAYMAPEQASEYQRIRPEMDLYSVGVVLYEFLSGKRPFDGTPLAIIVNKSRMAAPRPRVSASIPDALIDVVMKLIDRNPAHRYQHAADAIKALAPFADSPRLSLLPDSSSHDVYAPTLDGTGDPFIKAATMQTDGRTPSIWGRFSVIAHIATLSTQAELGHGAMVFLEAEMGMGSTALMNHIGVELAESGRFQILRANFRRHAGDINGLREVIESHLCTQGMNRADVGIMLKMHLQYFQENASDEYKALLQFLRPIEDGEAFAEGNQNAIFALFFRFIRRIAGERPVYLALDELDHDTELAASFLRYCLFELSMDAFPILICATIGLQQKTAALSRTLDAHKTEVGSLLFVHQLTPLTPETLAQGIRAEYRLNEDIAYGLAHLAGGSPLVAKNLAELCGVDEDAAHLLLAPNQDYAQAPLMLTPALNDILLRRIENRLSEQQDATHLATVLECVAILGVSAEYNLLRALVEGDSYKVDIDPLLDTLTTLDILRSEGTGAVERLSLNPGILKDFFIERLGEERRQDLHERAIEAYRDVYADKLHTVTGIIGDHHAATGNFALATEEWLSACAFELRNGDPLLGVKWGQKAVRELGLTHHRAVNCSLEIGRVLLDSGQLFAAIEILEPLVNGSSATNSMCAGEILADVYENQGDSEAWQALLEYLGERFSDADDIGIRAYLRARAMYANSYGQPRAGLADSLQALRDAPPGVEAQRAAQRAVYCCVAMGRPKTGRPYAERALAEAAGVPRLEVRSLRALGTVLTWLGDSEKAVSHHQRTLDICRDKGLFARNAIAYHDLGDAYRMSGDGAAASEAYKQALNHANRMSLGHTMELVNVKLMMCKLTDGETRGVVADLAVLGERALQAGLGLAVPFCAFLAAWAHAIDGHYAGYEKALAHVNDITAIALDPQVPLIVENIAQFLSDESKITQACEMYEVAATLWERQENNNAADKCKALALQMA